MEESNIENVVKQYLTMKTNYALMVSGKRGIGKTYFIKKKLNQTVESIPVFDNQVNNYKPVYISLFGLKSTEEIYTNLAFELMPFFKEKEGKVTLALGKILARGLAGFHKLGNLDDYLKDTSQGTKALIDTKNFVIIIDDLDRKSDMLPFNELIGFVNSLVEHDNNKIIIVADQSFMTDKDYAVIKEKTIGTTIEFTIPFSESYDNIIADLYKDGEDDLYYQYLSRTYRTDILELFIRNNTSNLRTLIYFLQHLKIIYGNVYTQLALDKTADNESNLSIFKYIILFSAGVAIEFKQGNISYSNRNGLDNSAEINDTLKAFFMHNMVHEKNSDKKEKTKVFSVDFLDRYTNPEKYNFIEPVYTFITGGNELKADELNNFIQSNLIKKDPLLEPHLAVLEQLNFPNYYNLPNKKLKSLTNKMLQYAKSGNYDLKTYLTVFYNVERLNDIFNYDLDSVKESLISAVKKNVAKFPYDLFIRHSFSIDVNHPHILYYRELMTALEEANQQVFINQKEKDLEGSFELFKANLDGFYRMVQTSHSSNAVFSDWNFRSFYAFFIKLPTTEIINFSNFISERYKGEKAAWFELAFFNKFVPKLKRRIVANSPLRDVVLNSLFDTIENFVFKKF